MTSAHARASLASGQTGAGLDTSGKRDLQPLCICCFGRGGSSLIWHFLSSSPDAWMMEHEWHREVFSGLSLARRGLKRIIRRNGLTEIGAGSGVTDRVMQGWIRRRMLANLRQDPALRHPGAQYVAVKLMDYNIVWHDAIRAAFGGGRTLVLTRAPVPQCESLMRSGRTLMQACAKYNEVSRLMALMAARPDALVLRFDAFLEDPRVHMSRLFAELGMAPPLAYFAKTKPYGRNRTPGTSVADKSIREIKAAALNDFVDPDVDVAAAGRLSETQIREIKARTAEAAARLGYPATGAA